MRHTKIAPIFFPLWLAMMSSCVAYRHSDVSEAGLRVIPETEKAGIQVRRVILKSGEEIIFNNWYRGVLSASTITGRKSVEKIAVPFSEVASLERSGSGGILRVRHRDGAITEASFWRETPGFLILTGTTLVELAFKQIRSAHLTHKDSLRSLLATLSIPVLGYAAVVLALSGNTGLVW